MTTVELIIILLVATAALAWLASRVRVPYPIFLTLAGLGISQLSRLSHGHFRPVELNPEVVFLIFLPPLLYHAGLMTSWRDFRSNLRAISMLAVGLVLFTMIAIAFVAHYAIGIGWGPAFVLGAIISPPDAVAATAITQRLRVPKRIVTILEGESLVNDASALIAYRVAIAAVAGGVFSLGDAGMKFVIAATGGIAVGYAVGKIMVWIRPRIHDPSVEGFVALLIPYIAFLPAEWLHLSGVLSVVTAGVFVGRKVPQIATSHGRLRLYAVWDTLVFLLNGLIFILIGLQLPAVIERLEMQSWGSLTGNVLVIGSTAILVRILWVFPAAYLPRLIPSIRRREPWPDPRQVFLVSWVGLRGIVSLAAALALPLAIPSGADFPSRDLIIFITFGVILMTLVGQGLTLPLVIKALRIGADDIEEREEEVARLQLANAALSRLQVMAILDESAVPMIDRVRQPYEQRLNYYGPRRRGIIIDDAAANCKTTDDVLRAALGAEREMLLKLRDTGEIGDDVLRKLQMELDLQEASLETEQ
ncbi:Na+/H+ antiporter [Humisphaera borealis]|uniref:Na+/H+ antiporter n=1 Tax=Humisphaera borealis TaxID=2807512 RepID=A0A7M2WTL0_9BACT|nr:Na+/H+ antiporter [Humisphaera borealis]QOV88604.1 Na+/H+ antiporter [Humisphaera borealis]